MTRITRAALIQASNDTPGEASIDEIKSAMIDKHVALIEQAAEQAVLASFSVEEDVFILGSAYSTEMGCDTALMDEDIWFTSFFQSSPTLSFDGERLTFTGTEATLVFLDSEIATPDQDLVGPTWEIDTFIDGEVAKTPNFTS